MTHCKGVPRFGVGCFGSGQGSLSIVERGDVELGRVVVVIVDRGSEGMSLGDAQGERKFPG